MFAYAMAFNQSLKAWSINGEGFHPDADLNNMFLESSSAETQGIDSTPDTANWDNYDWP